MIEDMGSFSLERHADFFKFARDRQLIYLKSKVWGQPKPWTEDKILNTFKFTNIFREQDRTTIWIKENIRDPLKDSPDVLLAIYIARWFNRIETLEKILEEGHRRTNDSLFYFRRWSKAGLKSILKDVQPVVSAAYIVTSPKGFNKMEGVLEAIDRFAPNAAYHAKLIPHNQLTIEQTTELLTHFPFVGPFLAYEIASDLRHTSLLRHAKDINTWANPGPGCARGFSRVCGHPPGHFNRGSKKDKYILIKGMEKLLDLSRKPEFWPQPETNPQMQEWPAWEMREVEHTLCEFDKYERARTGEGRPKQLYKG